MLKFLDNYPLKNVTTLCIGGPAKKFVVVKSQEELLEAIKYAKEKSLNYLVIGGGSNLLVADEGVNSLVIQNKITGISTWEESKPSRESSRLPSVGPSQVSVKSGTSLQTLVDYTIAHGLAGLQSLTGVPGTVGGAIYGNAGAYGQAISDHLVEVKVINSIVIPLKKGIHTNSYLYGSQVKPGMTGEESVMTKEECQFGYRDSIFKKNHFTILEARFLLTKSLEPLQKEAKEVLEKRLVKYPKGIKCPGSFFKNLVASELPAEILQNIPQEKIVYGKVPAGTLLEEVGAKGQSLDGIEIASYHANLLINKDNGTAKAFHALAKEYSQKVKEKFGITLEPEVQLINLAPLS